MELHRLENPKLSAPIADPSAAEIVGSKTPTNVVRTPDRVWASSVDGCKLEQGDWEYDMSETIHRIPVGDVSIEARYFGIRWAVHSVVPKMPFMAFAELTFEAHANMRYQVKGFIEGDMVTFWVVRLPDGVPVTEQVDVPVYDMTITGKFRARDSENVIEK